MSLNDIIDIQIAGFSVPSDADDGDSGGGGGPPPPLPPSSASLGTEYPAI